MTERIQNLNAEFEMIKRLFFSMLTNQVTVAACIMISMMANGIFVGKFLGAQDMAAFGLISPLYFLMSTISTTLAVGASTYCGTLLGKGNLQKAREVFTTNAVCVIIFSLVLTVAVILGVDGLCEIMGASGENANLKPSLISYVYGFAPAFLPMVATLSLMAFLYLEGAKKRILLSIVASTLRQHNMRFVERLYFLRRFIRNCGGNCFKLLRKFCNFGVVLQK